MRAPYQVLIIPFRRAKAGLEFAVLKRSDTGTWQFTSGGGEDSETPIQAAERETWEEIGIKVEGKLLALDSMTSIPKDCFHVEQPWASKLYVVPEYSFAVDVGSAEIVLSKEHTELRWVAYDEARALLKWDSNRTALWEVTDRLKKR
jgi:dihydroneopterin triphosphate diphosphatase